jgi:hypothetical protein
MIASNLASYLFLSSNNRVSNFYWIRGRKHCFLTSFSNLNCYLLFLVLLCNCYSQVSSRLSWLHGSPVSRPDFSYLCYSKVQHCTCAPIFLAHITCFLEARCLQEPGTRISTGFLSPFRLSAEGFSCKRPLGNHKSYLFFWLQSSNWHFLAWHKLHQVNAVQLGQGILKGFLNSWIKIECCLSEDSFWTISQALFALNDVPAGSVHNTWHNSAGVPWYKILCSGFLSGPLPYGMHLKVSPEWNHNFEWLLYPTPLKCSGCSARELGLIAQHPFLAVILSFGYSWGVCSWWHVRAEYPWRDTWRYSSWDSSSNAISSPFR